MAASSRGNRSKISKRYAVRTLETRVTQKRDAHPRALVAPPMPCYSHVGTGTAARAVGIGVGGVALGGQRRPDCAKVKGREYTPIAYMGY